MVEWLPHSHTSAQQVSSERTMYEEEALLIKEQFVYSLSNECYNSQCSVREAVSYCFLQ